jgi:hypothetical protein
MGMVKRLLEELGNFNSNWTVVVLHAPAINRAMSRLSNFSSQREYDYCKLLYPPSEVTEFQRSKFTLLFPVIIRGIRVSCGGIIRKCGLET